MLVVKVVVFLQSRVQIQPHVPVTHKCDWQTVRYASEGKRTSKSPLATLAVLLRLMVLAHWGWTRQRGRRHSWPY